MGLNFWNSITGIISGVFTVLSFIVAVAALKQAPQPSKWEHTRVEVVQRIEHIHETKLKQSNTSIGLTDEPSAMLFMGFIVCAIVVYFFSKYLHQIQTFVMVLGSVVLFVSTLLFWIARVRGIYPMTTNANIILVTSGLMWAVGFMVLTPIDTVNIVSVSSYHQWSDLTHNLFDLTWISIAFNALGVGLFSLTAFAVLVQLLKTVSILFDAEWLNLRYKELSWNRSIALWILVLGSGVLMHGYASLWFNHLHPLFSSPQNVTTS